MTSAEGLDRFARKCRHKKSPRLLGNGLSVSKANLRHKKSPKPGEESSLLGARCSFKSTVQLWDLD